MKENGTVPEAEQRPPGRAVVAKIPVIGLAHFGIPLGLTGTAGAWTAAAQLLGAPPAIADVLWAAAALFYLGFLIAYVAQKVRSRERLTSELDHPVLGPFFANLPIVAVLLLSHFASAIPAVAPWLMWALVAAAIAVAARLFAHWLTGGRGLQAVHPGYFFPVVAASFISSIGLSAVHQQVAASAAAVAGVFFWLVVGTVVTARLIVGDTLPDVLKPTLVVLAVPPALAGVSWLTLHDGTADTAVYGLVAIDILLIVVQLMLIPHYRTLRFSLSFWTFTFPVGVTANFAIRFLASSPFPGSTLISWAAVGGASVAVALVIAGTVALLVRAVRASRAQVGR